MGRFDTTSVETLVDSVAQEHVGTGPIPGAAVTVVQDTSVVFTKGYGVADVRSGRRVNPGATLFRVGSVTKLFTTTAALQLVEAGRLDLHTGVNRYLDGTLVPPRFGQPITLHHLLTHTAGLEDRFMGTVAYDSSEVAPLGTYLRQELPRRVRPPGEVASYSNHGMTLTGHLASTVADTAYTDLIEHRILSPLGMDRSAAALPALPDSLRPAIATPYHRLNGALVPHPRTYYQIAPAGGALVTASDMASFMMAHLNAGRSPAGRILTPERTRRMHRQQFTHHASLPGIAYGFLELPRSSPRMLSHGGGARGFTALLWIVPEEKLGVFVVCNLPDDSLQRALLEAFNTRFFPFQDTRAPWGAARGATVHPSTVTGHYRYVRHSQSTLEKVLALTMHAVVTETDSGLVAEGIAPQPVALQPRGKRVFRRSDGGLVAFGGVQEGTKASHLYVGEALAPAYERVSSWASPTRQGLLVGGFVLVFLLAILGAGLDGWRGGSRLTRAKWGAAGVGAAYLAFFIGFPLAFLEGPSGYMYAFFYGPSPALIAVLALPPIALGMSMYLAVRVIRAWTSAIGPVWQRVGLTGVVVASAACGVLLQYWNLLGWQF